MNRRRALWMLGALLGGLAAYIGFRWFRFPSKFHLSDLPNHRELVAALSDQIIPKSDSPSASQCLVHDFVIKMVMDCNDQKVQHNFMEGLHELENYCQANFKKSFIFCDKRQRHAAMSDLESSNQSSTLDKIKKRFLGKSFFSTLKEYTVIGYFTSQLGATQALRYSHIPAAYHACEPYLAGARAWATN